MVKVTDCGCCDCDDLQKKKQVEERALKSINMVYTPDNRSYYPDGTGQVVLPIPTQDQLDAITDIGTLDDRVEQAEKDIQALEDANFQPKSEKDSANGYAGLDNNNKLPLSKLYAGTAANQVPVTSRQLLANEMLVVDADGQTIRSKPVVQTISFRGIWPTKSQLPAEGNVSGDYAIVSDGTQQDDTGYYVWGYNNATSEYEWVWTLLFDANLYQLISNLVTEIAEDPDDSHYPSAKAIKDYHDASIAPINGHLETLDTEMMQAQTEITAVNTIANRAYDDVTITDNVLTFERGNGGTTEIEIPSGGSDGWEDVDLDNWPTDWVANTEIEILFKGMRAIASTSGSGWSKSINSISLSVTDKSVGATVKTQVSNNSYVVGYVPITFWMSTGYACEVTFYGTIGTTNGFNGVSSDDTLFQLVYTCFSGADYLQNYENVTISNIKNYILKIRRKVPA